MLAMILRTFQYKLEHKKQESLQNNFKQKVGDKMTWPPYGPNLQKYPMDRRGHIARTIFSC